MATIFTSEDFEGVGDLSEDFSPKYGQVHGGGKGNEEFSVGSLQELEDNPEVRIS